NRASRTGTPRTKAFPAGDLCPSSPSPSGGRSVVDVREVARVLDEIASLLELKGENPFKVRAYENAARALDGLTQDLGELIEAGTLTEVRGIGDSIALRITELWKTGGMKFYDELVAAVPPGYAEMVRVPGLGAKRVRILGETLEITSLAELKAAAEK